MLNITITKREMYEQYPELEASIVKNYNLTVEEYIHLAGWHKMFWDHPTLSWLPVFDSSKWEGKHIARVWRSETRQEILNNIAILQQMSFDANLSSNNSQYRTIEFLCKLVLSDCKKLGLRLNRDTYLFLSLGGAWIITERGFE